MLSVVRVGPLVTLQARPRRGHARHGVPGSGPLDDAAHRAALAAVGGDASDATIEIPLHGAAFRAETALALSVDGAPPVWLGPGEAFEVRPHARAVRYLAVAGGFAVPEVLGSRATLPVAGLGGFEGRPLRRGDRLPIGPPPSSLPPPSAATAIVLDVVDTVSLDLLEPVELAVPLTIDPRSDRVGTRLVGRIEGGGEVASCPLVPGAVQLPPDGRPIVVGPDGPTTGGYRVIGVLPRDARDALARLRPGAAVRLLARGGA